MSKDNLTQQLLRLKTKVEEAKTKQAKAKGALEQILNQIKKEFDCKTLKEAETLLKELKAKETKAKQKYEKALGEFQDKWREQLDDEDEE